MISIGKRFRQRRQNRGLTVHDVAEILDVDVSKIVLFEGGYLPLEEVDQLCSTGNLRQLNDLYRPPLM